MRRFVFAPRWLAGHLLITVLVVACVLLGRWQWHRSGETHSLQNYAYALQWPLFAVFFAVMWWRMLRLESRRLDQEADEPTPDRPAPAQVVAPAPMRAERPDDPELAAYNRMLAELAARDHQR